MYGWPSHSKAVICLQATAQLAVGAYADSLHEIYNSYMASKLGLKSFDRELSVRLLTAMYEDKADFTNTFRALSDVSIGDAPDSMPDSLRNVSPTFYELGRNAT